MLPSSFEYHRPTTIDEALDLLASLGDDAKVLAGGQSLIPMMKLRFAAPAHLVDINRIEGLDAIEEADGELHIGALVRHNQLAGVGADRIEVPDDRGRRAADRGPARAQPGHDRRLAHPLRPQRRPRRGDARARTRAWSCKSTDGEREVPVTEFLADTFQSSIEPNELLTKVRSRRRPAPTAART